MFRPTEKPLCNGVFTAMDTSVAHRTFEIMRMANAKGTFLYDIIKHFLQSFAVEIRDHLQF